MRKLSTKQREHCDIDAHLRMSMSTPTRMKYDEQGQDRRGQTAFADESRVVDQNQAGNGKQDA